MSSAPTRVLIGGEPRWVPLLLEQIPSPGITASPYVAPLSSARRLRLKPLVNFLRADIIHQVFVRFHTDRMYPWAHRLGKGVITHWIGSDVLALREHVDREGGLPSFLSEHVDVHLADSPALQDELQILGIQSQVIRLLPKKVEADVLPLPEKPAVLSYWQDDRATFYGSDIFMSLARAFPDASFYVAGATGKGIENAPANVSFLGEVADMEPVYRKVTALFRIVEHDSLSAMVLEAMARGRYVMYSETFPHTIPADGLDAAMAGMRQILTAAKPNEPGAAHVREHFSWRKEIEKLNHIYKELVARKSA